MNDGSKRIKISSRILLVALIVALIFMLSSLPVLGMMSSGMLVYFLMLMCLLIFEFVVAVLGIKYASDYSKANMLFTLGVILIALCSLSLITGIVNGTFSFSNLIQFILPIIFTTGAAKNKKMK